MIHALHTATRGLTKVDRSDLRPASAECRLSDSAYTAEQIRRRGHQVGTEMAAQGVLVVVFDDPGLTISQYDRAQRLVRELYPAAVERD